MEFQYYRSIANAIQNADRNYFLKWKTTPVSVRTDILRELLHIREVRIHLDLNDEDFFTSNDENSVHEWAEKDDLDGDLPMLLVPFVAMSFNGAGEFSLQCLQSETDRFCWHPRGTKVPDKK